MAGPKFYRLKVSIFTALPAIVLAILGYFRFYPYYLKGQLGHAVVKNDVVAVRQLLGRGADPNVLEPPDVARIRPQERLLIRAILNHHAEIVEALLKHGAKISPSPKDRHQALSFALGMRRADIARLLLDYGADVNTVSPWAESACHMTGGPKPDKALYGLLKSRGVRINVFEAVWNDDIETLVSLLHKGGDPNIKNVHGGSALHSAVLFGRADIVNSLLQSGANPNLVDASGYAPLHNVTNPVIVRALIQHGADVNLKSRRGKSPLDCARKSHRSDIVRLLVRYGARV